ncbi:MAG TPA: hypothetical protein VKX45_13420 [Bryobacteraceae bacterium]|jgi:hypothetical protein|nr:hypothetical protein [Bryobacteraceae bacterium]
MFVGSLTLALNAPPPETAAEFVVLAGALIAAVTVIGGYAAPVGSESLRVQEIPVQVQPEPERPVGIRPEPGASVTVTAPPVGPAVDTLETVRV